jgi:hypothetical protein
MVHERVGSAIISEGSNKRLRYDCTYFPGGRADPMSSGSISGGKTFTRDNESRRIWSKVGKEVGETDECNETAGRNGIKPESENAEYYC